MDWGLVRVLLWWEWIGDFVGWVYSGISIWLRCFRRDFVNVWKGLMLLKEVIFVCDGIYIVIFVLWLFCLVILFSVSFFLVFCVYFGWVLCFCCRFFFKIFYIVLFYRVVLCCIKLNIYVIKLFMLVIGVFKFYVFNWDWV